MKESIIILILSILSISCIDRISIETPNPDSQLVVEGLITDEPGPYQVVLSKASRLDENLNFRKYITAKSVTISDNLGNSELLKEVSTGVYQTREDGIRGVVGREYSIRIETVDGKIYESLPDKMNPVGEVDSIYYEYETYQSFDGTNRYGLRLYADGRGLTSGNNFYIWKAVGTFQLEAYPQLHTAFQCAPAPRPCASDGPNGSCTCCTCWANDLIASKPVVSDNRFVSNGVFKRVEIGFASLDYYSFQVKYRLGVKQMSLSRAAFDYWKTVQSQIEGTGSLFQPPFGKLKTNIFNIDGSDEALGIFHASAVKNKYLYLRNADVLDKWRQLTVPFWNCERGVIAEDCRMIFGATTTKPADWE